MVLEKTLESPLDCREIQPVLSKGPFLGPGGTESGRSARQRCHASPLGVQGLARPYAGATILTTLLQPSTYPLPGPFVPAYEPSRVVIFTPGLVRSSFLDQPSLIKRPGLRWGWGSLGRQPWALSLPDKELCLREVMHWRRKWQPTPVFLCPTLCDPMD